eukprot:3411725-Alexandrium_andersonii.AAC.1
MNLGIMLAFGRHTIWFLLDKNVYGLVGSAGERLASAVLRLRGELMAFYKEYKGQNEDSNLTQVADLTPAMLGTPEHPLLKTKAAETHGIVLFLDSQLAKHRDVLGPEGQVLRDAGRCLIRFVEIMEEEGPILP